MRLKVKCNRAKYIEKKALFKSEFDIGTSSKTIKFSTVGLYSRIKPKIIKNAVPSQNQSVLNNVLLRECSDGDGDALSELA